MKSLLVLSFLVLASCASMTPKQTVFQLESEYQLALTAAVAYKNLPKCGTAGAPLVCSDAVVVAKLQQADSVAGPAIFAAQAAVRDPNFDKSKADAVLVAANQALAVLTTILAEVKK